MNQDKNRQEIEDIIKQYWSKFGNHFTIPLHKDVVQFLEQKLKEMYELGMQEVKTHAYFVKEENFKLKHEPIKEIGELKQLFMEEFTEEVDDVEEWVAYDVEVVWSWIETKISELIKRREREAVEGFVEYCWDGRDNDSFLIKKRDDCLKEQEEGENEKH